MSGLMCGPDEPYLSRKNYQCAFSEKKFISFVYCETSMIRSKGGASGKGGPYNRMSRAIENKLLNCIDLYRSEGLKDMSPLALIDYCLKVDSSLRRMKRRQVELALEKVLADFDTATPQEPES